LPRLLLQSFDTTFLVTKLQVKFALATNRSYKISLKFTDLGTPIAILMKKIKNGIGWKFPGTV